MTSSRLYSAVTKYWPRIAAGLVVLIGLAEVVVGGMTADSGLEFYVFAWAATTGGLWFLFEKSETALSSETRSKVARRLREADVRDGIESIPAQFEVLTDRLLGVRTLSWRCFGISCLASAVTALIVGAVVVARYPGLNPTGATTAGVLAIVLIVNTLPDFASLGETRALIRFAAAPAGTEIELNVGNSFIEIFKHAKGLERMLLTLMGDFLATIGISGVFWAMAVGQAQTSGWDLPPVAVLVGFFSSFFTSVWLWLYAASVLLGRVLLRMNSGVGFLLRVTDVENQPFRSMGFVSVIIVSCLFALGLPLVLL